MKLKPGPECSGLRLDRYLRKMLPGVPLSHIHRMLRKGEVRSGGKQLAGADRMTAGMSITLRLPPSDAASERREPQSAGTREAGRRPAAGAPPTLRIPVLYEDADVIAFDKPTGVAAHPGSGHDLKDTVLGALLERCGGGAGPFRPGLVGRLDRDASGVQLAGKSPAGLRGLEEASRSGGIRKKYVGLVLDPGLPARGRIDWPLVDRSRGRARMEVLKGSAARAAREAGEAVAAVTEFHVLARRQGTALVELSLGTGRRHQIRAHMAAMGAPLGGDARYGEGSWNFELRRQLKLSRLFLHCAQADFTHPMTGRPVLVASALPRELEEVLRALGI